MRDERVRLAFAELHPDRLAALVEGKGNERRALAAIRSGRARVPDGARRAVEVPAEQRYSALAAAGITYLDRDDPGYPPHLAALPGSPPGLFVEGTLPVEPGVAVVGTRRCTRYGRRLARAYGRAIAAAGWTLVSGLARGIDGAAHFGTVDADGNGIAVLGSGVDVLYPREHTGLAESLLACGGAVVSEYPPGAVPYPWRFPPRNRIISGLSRAVVVVEAGVKGGALITARLALDQGVSVFAVPGDIQRESSRGCNLLIRDGAHPVLDPDDLVEELALILGPPAAPIGRTDETDDPMLSVLRKRGEASVDELAEDLTVSVAEVLVWAVRLETAGLADFDGATVRTATG
jgi:DNA processing protein